MLTLYYAKGTVALASHLALQEAGANYQAIEIDFAAAGQRSADYLAVNPKGRVPALICEHGTLTETPAILAYIAQTFADAELAPLNDPFAFAEAQAFNCYLCATVHVAHAHGGRGARWVEANDEVALAAMKAKVPQTMSECFALIEDDMLRGPWVLGDRFSICDLYLFTITRWLQNDGVAVADFPKVAAHFAAVAQRPASGAVLPLHDR